MWLLGLAALVGASYYQGMSTKSTVLLLLAIGTAVASYLSLGRSTRKYRGWKRTSGRIVAIKYELFTDLDINDTSTSTHNVHVTFRTATGQEVTYVDATYVASDRVGKQVPVAYDPQDPSNAVITGARLYMIQWFGMILAVVLLLCAIAS